MKIARKQTNDVCFRLLSILPEESLLQHFSTIECSERNGGMLHQRIQVKFHFPFRLMRTQEGFCMFAQLISLSQLYRYRVYHNHRVYSNQLKNSNENNNLKCIFRSVAEFGFIRMISLSNVFFFAYYLRSASSIFSIHFKILLNIPM